MTSHPQGKIRKVQNASKKRTISALYCKKNTKSVSSAKNIPATETQPKKRGRPAKIQTSQNGTAKAECEIPTAIQENPLSFLYDSPVQSQPATSQPETEERRLITGLSSKSVSPVKMKCEISSLQAKVVNSMDSIGCTQLDPSPEQAQHVQKLKSKHTELKMEPKRGGWQRALHKVDVVLEQLEPKM